MNITFKTKKLQKLFNQKKELIRKYGERRAKLMQLRMIQIQAAQSLADLGPPYSGPARCHELKGNRAGTFSVDLEHPYRLLFYPNHDPVPTREEGGIDWSQITAIEIIGVENTYPKENQFMPDYAIPPGETLAEELAARGMSQAEVAVLIGTSKEIINEIIKGKTPITAEMALKLESVFQLPSHFWVNLEQQYQETLLDMQVNQTVNNTKSFFNEVISSARYLVNTSGSKTDVVLSLVVWKKLLTLLEKLDDRKVVQ
ncbi:MAG: HigA family addiction module antidote protein [Thiomargarita sp.]|nr:HigA family addiction module antidote protein [Thiomargarita sp.]